MVAHVLILDSLVTNWDQRGRRGTLSRAGHCVELVEELLNGVVVEVVGAAKVAASCRAEAMKLQERWAPARVVAA